MQVKISPSILSADFADIGAAISRLERAGADLIHCDVMDGSFVVPITFGAQMVAAIRSRTALPLDVHLMVEHPQTHIKSFAEAGADIICVHFEACKKISASYLKDTLALIRSFGVKCGVVVNPDTDVESVFGVLPLCDMLLVMSVFPGYGGQKFMPQTLKNVEKARAFAESEGLAGLDISIDGGITPQNAAEAVAAGANVLVAGSAVFKSQDMAATIAALRS